MIIHPINQVFDLESKHYLNSSNFELELLLTDIDLKFELKRGP